MPRQRNRVGYRGSGLTATMAEGLVASLPAGLHDMERVRWDVPAYPPAGTDASMRCAGSGRAASWTAAAERPFP